MISPRTGATPPTTRSRVTPPWPHLCSLHVDALRIVVAFPEDGVVAIVKIARHEPASDPYREIADDLGITVSTAERTTPPRCDESGLPRVDPVDRR